jgi:hypothetical protein
MEEPFVPKECSGRILKIAEFLNSSPKRLKMMTGGTGLDLDPYPPAG